MTILKWPKRIVIALVLTLAAIPMIMGALYRAWQERHWDAEPQLDDSEE